MAVSRFSCSGKRGNAWKCRTLRCGVCVVRAVACWSPETCPSDALSLHLGRVLSFDAERPVGLVLSGGGARGTFQVGVWKVLRLHPRGFRSAPQVISGTSAGALNGALIAAGLTPDEMLEFWLGLADNPPVQANEKFFSSLVKALYEIAKDEPLRGLSRRMREVKTMGRLFRKHRWYAQSGALAMAIEFFLTARFDTVSALLDGIDTTYLFDTSPVRARLKKLIGGEVLPPTETRLAINTVDTRTGNVIRIVNHPPVKATGAATHHYRYEPKITIDMILASSSIPLLFNPVKVGDLELWDGGLLVNSPMAPVVALGAQRIVPVLVTVREQNRSRPMSTFGHAVECLVDTLLENAYNIDRKLLLDRNALADRVLDPELRKVQLFRPIRPREAAAFNAGSYLYFEREAMLAMYEAGQQAALAWLERGPTVDGRNLPEQ